MTFLFFLNAVGFGIALAMDAFSVSMANGLNEPKMRKAKLLGIGGIFGFFQALMPMIGWICIHTVLEYFQTFEKFIPWIALLLLSYIGGKMLVEGIRNKEGDASEYEVVRLTFGGLIVQGIATSIDALSVGFDIAEYDFPLALLFSLIVAVVTFGISVAGVLIGRKFGTRLAGKASILGGVILIAIGLEIFGTSFFS